MSIFDTPPITTNGVEHAALAGWCAPASKIQSVSLSPTARTLLGPNPSRSGFVVKNDSGQTLFIALGPSVSPTRYTIDLQPGAIYIDDTGWKGAVSGCLPVATGLARITELTT